MLTLAQEMKNTRRGLVFYIIAKTFGITLLFLKKGC